MMRIAILLSSMLAAAGAHADEWRMQDKGELAFEPTWEGQAVPGRFESFDVALDTGDGRIDIVAEIGIAEVIIRESADHASG